MSYALTGRAFKVRETVNILGVKIDNITADDAVQKAVELVRSGAEGRAAMMFTPNPEIIMAAREDNEFRDVINCADLCTADGIGVIYGAKILKTPLPERVTGFDTVCAVFDKLKDTDMSVFLFGSKPGVAEAAAEELKSRYAGLKIAGTHNGYFSEEETPAIVDEINASGARLLLVCLGMKKQENWIFDNRNRLNVGLCMGLGGVLDVFAGNVKRAPDFFVKHNLEWFYRLVKQPSRFVRCLALPKFLITVIRHKRTEPHTPYDG